MRNWIKGSIRKKGSLSRQLGIPEKENIPVTLLRKIVKTEKGRVVKNPTKKGKKRIMVTPLLKKRANLAIILKRLSKRR